MIQTNLPLNYKDTGKIPDNFHHISELNFNDVEGEIIGIDIETNDMLNPYSPHSEVICISISGLTQVYYVHKNEFKQCLNVLRRIIESETCMIIGHNIKFDINFMCKKFGWNIRCLVYDTMIANYFLNESDIFVSLEELCTRHNILDSHKKIKGDRRISDLPFNELIEYNGNDARACAILKHQIFDPNLKEIGCTKLMGVASEAIKVLSRMETRGVLVDMVYAKQQQLKLYELMIDKRKMLKELSCTMFNPDSPSQLARVLYGGFKFYPFKIGVNHGSTDAESILRIRQEQCEDREDEAITFIETLIQYNSMSTLNEKYYNKLNKWIQTDGAVHTNYNLGATTTGRLTSSNPNMQNQKRGSEFRGVYVPRPGYMFLEGDWSQIELRFAAFFANETRMLDLFKQCLDVHTSTMCMMKDWDYDDTVRLLKTPTDPNYQEVKNLRVGIKNFNFGELYGASPYRLQRELVKNGIYWNEYQCQYIYDERKRLYPEIGRWKKEVSRFVVQNKYVRMPFGQIRRLPLADWISEEGRHQITQAINFIIQSTASGWVPIIGMIILDNYFYQNKIDGHVLLNVHDSILSEVKIYSDKKMQQIKQDIQQIMEQDILEYIETVFKFKITVPLEFECSYLERWR